MPFSTVARQRGRMPLSCLCFPRWATRRLQARKASARREAAWGIPGVSATACRFAETARGFAVTPHQPSHEPCRPAGSSRHGQWRTPERTPCSDTQSSGAVGRRVAAASAVLPCFSEGFLNPSGHAPCQVRMGAMAPNLHTWWQTLQPKQTVESMRAWNVLPLAAPRMIAGQPSLKQAPQALHFSGSTQ